MNNRKWHAKGWPATPMLAALISLGVPAVVHATPTQSGRAAQDNDITRQELALFDQFLDSHREIAEQVQRDPSLVNNDQFVKNHPALQTFMQQHPAVREELKENPKAFMHREAVYERHEDNRMREERIHFDRFLDSHREIAEQLRRNPRLINDEIYVKGHPELQTYLQDHPEFQETVRKDPDAFTRADNDQYSRHDSDDRDRDARRDNDARDRDARADNRDRDARRDNDDRLRQRDADDRDRDARRDELANFDHYLDSHRETAEQIRKNPSLVNNDEFVKNHPSLQSYLQQHPEVRTAIKQDPNAFMQQEARYDQNEYRMRSGQGDEPHRHFGEFADAGKTAIARNWERDLLAHSPDAAGFLDIKRIVTGIVSTPEYSLADDFGFFRGQMLSLNTLLPEVMKIDLYSLGLEFREPIFFFEGRYDPYCRPSLVVEYTQTIKAPQKEVVWFDNSGHFPFFEEQQKFKDELVQRVLPLAN